jgi:hypothetical protein
MQLRPVIDADVLRVALPEFHFCPECGKKAKHILSNINSAADEFAERRIGDFQFIYRCGEDIDYLEIRGPATYVEHGTGVLLRKRPAWAPRRFYDLNGRPGKMLSPSSVKRNKLLQKFLLRSFVGDLIFQQLYGYRYGTKYLTDLPGEAEFLGASSPNDELRRRTAALCAGLTHSVPLLGDISLATVLRIRRQDPGSFVLYRQALGKILQEYLGTHEEVSETDAGQIYRDVLQPELIKLKREAAAQTRSKRAKVIAKTLIPATVVSLGVISGLLPSDIAQLAKIVGATTLLNQAVESLFDNAGSAQVRNHNLYFLLQLAGESGPRARDEAL